MFERFTDRARRVLVLAQEEARLLSHSFIGTEHLLLGLISEHEGVAAVALRQSGVTLESARRAVQDILGFQQAGPSGSPPFTPRAKKCLELALREALSMSHNYIGTEHLLLGVLREGEGVACVALVRLGIDLEGLRGSVIELMGGGNDEAAAAMAQTSSRERLEVAEGLLRALAQLAEIVTAVGPCADRAAAVAVLSAPPFDYTPLQVPHLLGLRVDMLTEERRQALRDEIEQLRGLAGDDD